MKKQITTLILVTILPINIYAQSCGNLPDGAVVRIDSENGSLRNSRTQDQDGLGTCYANTASVLLQPALPDSPNVSYINLAISYGEKVNGKNITASAYDSKNQLLITGGTICETIRVAKENGGVCNRADVPLEAMLFENNLDMYNDNTHVQKEIFDKVSEYYDGVNKSFNSQAKGFSSGSSKQKFINPEVKIKIQEGAKSFGETMARAGEKIGSFLSGIGAKFKNFFDSIFDRKKDEPIDPPHTEPVIVDLNKGEGDSSSTLPDKDEKGLQDIIDQANKADSDNATDTSDAELTDEEIFALKPEDAAVDPNLFSREKFEALRRSKKKLSEKEKYQLALYDLIQKKAPEYSLKNCETLDTSNALSFSQNLAALLHNAGKAGKHDPVSSNLRWQIYNSYSIRNPGLGETYEFIISADFKNMLEKVYLKSLTNFPAPKSGKDAMVSAIKTLINKKFTDKQVADILNQLDPQTLELLEDDYNRYAKKDYSKCSKDKLAYFKNQDGMMQDFASHPCLSQYQKLGEGIQGLVSGFDKSNIGDFEKLSDFILNSPDMNYENALTMLLAPTCTDEQKIKIPASLSCNENHIMFGSFDTNSPQKLEKKMAKERADLFKDTRNSLSNGLAVGASLCTIFFKEDPNYFYNSSNNCKATRGDSFHAVSIIGYRCNAGKIDYLIQNSWGEWRDLDDTKYQREGTTGKAWIDEDSLIKNTYQYSTLTK